MVDDENGLPLELSVLSRLHLLCPWFAPPPHSFVTRAPAPTLVRRYEHVGDDRLHHSCRSGGAAAGLLLYATFKQYQNKTMASSFTDRNKSFLDREVAEFLTHVIKGEQRQVKEMLKKNRHLALASGTVTDHADRTFNHITGFQYAVWALDWHMWSMIQKYLPEEAAQFQARGFTTGPWVEQHGVQANWQNLLDAYEHYLDNYGKLFKASKWTELNNIWLMQIGGAQKSLPMHVFHEYCHPGRPFDPVPDFTKGPLPRTLPDWFRLDKVSSDYSIYRTAALRPKMWRDAMHKPVVKAVYHYTCDRNSLTQLASTRSLQREQLVAELTPGSKSSPGLLC